MIVEMAMRATERVLPPENTTPPPALSPELLKRYGMDMLPGPDPLRQAGH